MPLKPQLGPVQLVFYAVGVIVGAGVYSVIGAAAGLAQESLWLSFVLGALVAFLTGLSYAEMTTSFPTAGAEYVYLQRAVPNWEWAAFVVAVVILAGAAAAATTVAVAFGGYLRVFVDVPVGVSASLLLAGCTVLNIWGMRESSVVNIVFTSVEIAGLLLVIGVGLTANSFVSPLASTPHAGILPAAAVIFFVYLGFEEIANMAEEVRHPARDLPMAIFVSIAITTILYVLVSLAAISLASPAELAASQAPLATAVQGVWPAAGSLLSAIALFATANTVLITLVASSRLAFSMGRDGELPPVFSRLLPGRHTPWVAAVATLAMAIVLVPIGDIKILAELSSFAALLAFLAVNVALIILRYRMPDHRRPFRVPWSVGRIPVLPVAAIASIGLLLAYFDRMIYVAGAIGLGLGALLYLTRRQWRRRRR